MRVVIIGAGQVGSAIVGALAGENVDVVAIDQSEQKLEGLRDSNDIQTICGSGSNPRVLAEAGVASSDMVVAVTDSDEVNMVASAIAGMRAPHTIRVARIRETAFLDDPALLGPGGFNVNHPINPEMVAARRIAAILEVPFASDVADCGSHLKLVGLRLPYNTPMAGLTFSQLRVMTPDLKVLVTTRIRAGEVVVPTGTDDMQPGDTLYVLSAPDDLRQVAKALQMHWRVARRITIAGGTGIAALLARQLVEHKKYSIKIIEADAERASRLAEMFEDVLVLQGSSTDESLLLEENIRDCDVFVAALPEDEMNVMAALNAKRLGAHRVVALTNRLAYVPLIAGSGVDAVVSPRALAIGTIIHHVRKGRINTVIPYGDAGQAEAIEFEALATAPAVGKPLRTVKFPEGSIVGAIVRDDKTIIPGGDDIIAPGDRVFVFATRRAVPKLEKLMSVSLTFF